MAVFKYLAKNYTLTALQIHYVEFYGHEFDVTRESVNNIILVGDTHGWPLQLWSDYFPNATIHNPSASPAPSAAQDIFTATNGDVSLIILDGTDFNTTLRTIFGDYWAVFGSGTIFSIENCGLSFDTVAEPNLKQSLGARHHDRPSEKAPDGTSLVDAAINRHVDAFINDAEWVKMLFNRWLLLVKKGVMGADNGDSV